MSRPHCGNRAVFLDRDGTLIEDRDYLSRPEEVRLFAGVGEALSGLIEADYKLFMVTNQSGIGRGFFTWADLERVHNHLLGSLARKGVRFEKVYVAPEMPGAASRWRKPSPQSLRDAAEEFGLNLRESYMIGDKWIDLQCGWQAGVRKSLLVRTGYGRQTEEAHGNEMQDAVVVDDLPAAAAWILRQA